MRKMLDLKVDYNGDEVIINDGIAISPDGDVAVGKDLEVEGTITANGEELNPKCELIEQINLTSAETSIYRSQTPSGEAYNYRAIYVWAITYPDSWTVDTWFKFTDSQGNVHKAIAYAFSASTNYPRTIATCENRNGMLYATATNWTPAYGHTFVYPSDVTFNTGNIVSLEICCSDGTTPIPSNTRISIYGVK